jgi:multidrug resistance efflux pump
MFSTIAKYVVPLIAVILVAVAVVYITVGQQESPGSTRLQDPAVSPFETTVAAVGLVEASRENIAIGAQRPGVCTKVLVREGDEVEPGDPLIEISKTADRARLDVRRAELDVAQARLERLRAEPRQERIPVSKAAVAAAEAEVTNAKDTYERNQELAPTDSVAQSELVASRARLESARATLRQAKAETDLLLAGAWKYDIDKAEADAALARAQVDRIQAQLKLLTVYAPVKAQVLRVTVQPGEYVAAGPAPELMVLGQTETLHIRVDINESDIPRFEPGNKAIAYLRGNRDQKFPLRFVRLEPFVVPKTNLSGDLTERVDVRVLQAIYEVDLDDDRDLPLYVGQQVDVFIEG